MSIAINGVSSGETVFSHWIWSVVVSHAAVYTNLKKINKYVNKRIVLRINANILYSSVSYVWDIHLNLYSQSAFSRTCYTNLFSCTGLSEFRSSTVTVSLNLLLLILLLGTSWCITGIYEGNTSQKHNTKFFFTASLSATDRYYRSSFDLRILYKLCDYYNYYKLIPYGRVYSFGVRLIYTMTLWLWK